MRTVNDLKKSPGFMNTVLRRSESIAWLARAERPPRRKRISAGADCYFDDPTVSPDSVGWHRTIRGQRNRSAKLAVGLASIVAMVGCGRSGGDALQVDSVVENQSYLHAKKPCDHDCAKKGCGGDTPGTGGAAGNSGSGGGGGGGRGGGGGDRCVTGGGMPVIVDDGNPCTRDFCDPVLGPVHEPLADGTACSDGDACTTGDACVVGQCRPGVPKACPGSDACHADGVCNPGNGACTNPARPDGTSCSDGNACNGEETCHTGVCSAGTPPTTVFASQFDGALPPEIDAGTATLTGVQGYAGLGGVGNQFGGSFLRSETGNVVTLRLTNLAPHTGLKLQFLFAAIDSLDGTGVFPAGDFFQITVDDVVVFNESFANALPDQIQSYTPAPGVELARRIDLGFGGPGSYYTDSAYDLGLDPAFASISHTATTATVRFTILGPGVQSLDDESWALDNLQVRLTGDVCSSCGMAGQPACASSVGHGP